MISTIYEVLKCRYQGTSTGTARYYSVDLKVKAIVRQSVTA